MNKSSETSKNDQAWANLFTKYNILDHINRKGFYEISAVQINEFREARLMTKFDHRVNLPKLFANNNLAILPITRGSYIISKFEVYKDFEQLDNKVTKAFFPSYIESIDYEHITSEAMAINCAFITNIIADFLEDEKLVPTVNGRMSSDSFSFKIRNTATNSNFPVNVVNSQLEIDGGYEGIKRLALIEAKNYISDDFIIRQLYYPYRLWSKRTSKKITPVFLVYTNGVFSLYEYIFEDLLNYNSLVLLKQRNYCIDSTYIALNDITDLLKRISFIEEPKVAFPQADNFKRLINLCELLYESDMAKDSITLNYAFDPRQTNYYTDAGRYLGLISKSSQNSEILFSLTEDGRRILSANYKTRQLKFAEAILKHRVFAEALRLCLKNNKMPTRNEIIEIMEGCHLYQVEAKSTYYRRASTVISWVNWILDLTN